VLLLAVAYVIFSFHDDLGTLAFSEILVFFFFCFIRYPGWVITGVAWIINRLMTSSLGNINKPSGCAVFDNFLLTLKTNHDASGFYDVNGTW